MAFFFFLFFLSSFCQFTISGNLYNAFCVSWLWSGISDNIFVGAFQFFENLHGKILTMSEIVGVPKSLIKKLLAKIKWKRQELSRRLVEVD